MIEITTTLTLRCDRCNELFSRVNDLHTREPDPNRLWTSLEFVVLIATVAGVGVVERVEDWTSLEFVVLIATAAGQLRDFAQAADWAHVLPIAQAPRDLCPACFRLPPEG